MENQAALDFDQNPKARKFKLHKFRGTAMSVAKMADVSFEEAAIAFGCHLETLREHYLALDEVAITDRVMAEIQGFGKGGGAVASAPADQAAPSTPAS